MGESLLSRLPPPTDGRLNLIAYVLLTPFLFVSTVFVYVFRWIAALLDLRIDTNKRCNIVITGCDSGFGWALVKRLNNWHSANVTVFAMCYTPEAVKSLGANPQTKAFQCDITSDENVDKALNFVLKRSKESGVFALINNAGINRPSLVSWSTMAEFEETFQANLFGHFRMTRAFLPSIVASQGRIIYTASIFSHVASPWMSAYVASKHALFGFAKSLQCEVAQFGVKVITLCPGHTDTGIIRTVGPQIRKKFNQLNKEQQEAMGTDFPEYMVRTYEQLFRIYSASNSIESVTDTFEYALFARYPFENYWVGYDSQVVRIVHHFPECVMTLVTATLKLLSGNTRDSPFVALNDT